MILAVILDAIFSEGQRIQIKQSFALNLLSKKDIAFFVSNSDDIAPGILKVKIVRIKAIHIMPLRADFSHKLYINIEIDIKKNA